MRASLYLLLFLAAACSTAPPSGKDSLPARLDSLLADAGEETAVSALVVSLPSGTVIYEQEPRRLLHPASTLKVLTAAAACAAGLGSETVETRVAVRRSEPGVLRLLGGGDAFLSAADLQALARDVQSSGTVWAITALEANDSFFSGPALGVGWMWDDEPAPFMPHIGALTVDGGVVQVTVDASGSDLSVSLTPASDHLRIDNQARLGATGAGKQGALSIDRLLAGDGRTIAIRGFLPAGQSVQQRLSVPEPAKFAAEVFKHFLVQAGLVTATLPISLSHQPPQAELLELARRTRPIAEILIRTMKESDNLGAECLLRLLAVQAGRAGTAAAGLDLVGAYLERVGTRPGSYRLVDGSGVSHYNLLTAEVLVSVLVDMERRPRTRSLFRRSLPVAGRDGTLSERMRSTGAAGRVRAKTGTLSGVSTLAGYVETASGESLAFALLIQNFIGSPEPWRRLQDRICIELVGSGG